MPAAPDTSPDACSFSRRREIVAQIIGYLQRRIREFEHRPGAIGDGPGILPDDIRRHLLPPVLVRVPYRALIGRIRPYMDQI
jgi:hypothetical protein